MIFPSSRNWTERIVCKNKRKPNKGRAFLGFPSAIVSDVYARSPVALKECPPFHVFGGRIAAAEPPNPAS